MPLPHDGMRMVPCACADCFMEANKADISAAKTHALLLTTIELLLPPTRVTVTKYESSAAMAVTKALSYVVLIQCALMEKASSCSEFCKTLAMFRFTQPEIQQPLNEVESGSLPGAGLGRGIQKLFPGRRATLKDTPHFTQEVAPRPDEAFCNQAIIKKPSLAWTNVSSKNSMLGRSPYPFQTY